MVARHAASERANIMTKTKRVRVSKLSKPRPVPVQERMTDAEYALAMFDIELSVIVSDLNRLAREERLQRDE